MAEERDSPDAERSRVALERELYWAEETTSRVAMDAQELRILLQDLVAEMRAADASIVNLETVIHEFNGHAQADSGGIYTASPPAIAGELKWAGVDMVAHANNHAFDYGEGGLLATTKHLDAAGIAHAGSGANLAEARMPGYLDTRGGRVAILSTTSTFRPWNRAGAQRPDLRGRPGINPFGGWKASGYTGRGTGGPYYVQQFMREQSRVRVRGV